MNRPLDRERGISFMASREILHIRTGRRPSASAGCYNFAPVKWRKHPKRVVRGTVLKLCLRVGKSRVGMKRGKWWLALPTPNCFNHLPPLESLFHAAGRGFESRPLRHIPRAAAQRRS